MAKPYKKNGKWYLRFRDGLGVWRDQLTAPTPARRSLRHATVVFRGSNPRTTTARPRAPSPWVIAWISAGTNRRRPLILRHGIRPAAAAWRTQLSEHPRNALGWDAALVMVDLPLALAGGAAGVYLSGGVLSVAPIIGSVTSSPSRRAMASRWWRTSTTSCGTRA